MAPEDRLCIVHARLVSGRGLRRGGVAVGADGRIRAVLEDGAPAVPAETVLDAGDRLLFPGFIDAHVHMRDPGFRHKEDFGSGTRAAACGGVTTVMCMPNTDPPATSPAGFAAAREAGEAASHVDFMLQGGVTRSNIRSLGELWRAGAVTLEAFLSDAGEEDRLDGGLAAEAAGTIRAFGGTMGVYAGDHARLAGAVAELRAVRSDFRAFAEARSATAEESGIRSAIALCRKFRVRTVLRQVSTAGGFDLVRAARREDRELPLAVEATPHHLQLDDGLLEVFGGFGQVIPPLRPPRDRDAAVAALADGTADFVGSDHAPHAEREKTGNVCWTVPAGIPGLDTLVPAVLDLAARGAISWPDVARLLAERPARLFGLSGRKGRIAPGADGDLVLVDPGVRRAVSRSDIRSRAGRSPFEGRILAGWPVATILRGKVIARDGELVSERPGGRFTRRGTSRWER